MTWIPGRDPVNGWAWLEEPALVLGSSYPARVDVSKPDPDYKPRPVGFTAQLDPPKEPPTQQPETEPIDDLLDRAEQHTRRLNTRRCDRCGDVLPYHYRSCPTLTEDPWQ